MLSASFYVRISSRMRAPFFYSWLHALLLVFTLLLLTTGARAAVPHNSAVPAYAEEQTILQTERDQPEPGYSSAASGREHFDRHFIVPPGFMPEQDLILQRGGNTWRTLRNGPLAAIAGTLILVVPILIFILYRIFGPARLGRPESGHQIQRFSDWDRLTHWATAISFLTLALTGLIVLFGKKVLMPWMGHELFSWIAVIAKYLHNFVGPLFILCSIALFLTFVRRNVFQHRDWIYLRKAGGLFSREHIPVGYFNAGEKIWFWGGVTLLGLVMSITGLLLDFPYFIGLDIGATRYMLQFANYFHLGGAALYISAAMGHIYLGTLGVPGTYRGMRHGTVDAEWAREHHEQWYSETITGGAPPGGTPPAHPIPPGAAPRPGA